MKPVKAWAVLVDGKLACWDYRLPLTWLRRLAREDAKEYSSTLQVVRVEIREIKKSQARKGGKK